LGRNASGSSLMNRAIFGKNDHEFSFMNKAIFSNVKENVSEFSFTNMHN
jgi:hypothetical protein